MISLDRMLKPFRNAKRCAKVPGASARKACAVFGQADAQNQRDRAPDRFQEKVRRSSTGNRHGPCDTEASPCRFKTGGMATVLGMARVKDLGTSSIVIMTAKMVGLVPLFLVT